MSQSSSQARLKFVKLGDDDLRQLYHNYECLSTVDFQSFCVGMIEQGSGGKAKKYKVTITLQSLIDKNKMLKTTQDFILAGMGLGV